MAISLQKIEQQAPKLIDLTKKANISLAKVGLSEHQAQVAFCLDISASMSDLYKNGLIQQFAERLLALACRFDDDGAVQVFLFGENGHTAGEMNLRNFSTFIEDLLKKYRLEGGTKYGKAVDLVINHYFPNIESNTNIEVEEKKEEKPGFFKKLFGGGSSAPKENKPKFIPVTSNVPVYVMFLTDGEASDSEKAVEAITKASFAPIFWQFMAVGTGSFRLLERLDDLKDRYEDNADFFSVPTPNSLPDNQLYDKLMAEYPKWLTRAKAKGLLR